MLSGLTLNQLTGGRFFMPTPTIAQWLRGERKKAHAKQALVYGPVGIHRGYYSDVENGKHRPAFETWEKLARQLEPNITRDNLMKIWVASDPDKKDRRKNTEEKRLIEAWRKKDIDCLLQMVSTLAA